jgi:hypothetical protein
MFQYIKTIFSILAFATFSCFNAQNTGDTITINLSNSKILIISAEEVDEWDFEAEEIEDAKKKERKLKLRPELFFGSNGYLSSLNNLNLPNEHVNMEINYLRSNTFATNMMLKGIEIKNKRFYFSPGIGISKNNYFFGNPIRLQNENDSTLFITDTITNFNKYKLSSTYLQLPLILGLRLGNLNKKTIGIQLGFIAGYKVNSKVINHYEDNGSHYKSKEYNSFNLQPFKLSTVGRLSIGKIGVYASYSITSLFIKNSAANVYPFSLGLMIGGF